MPAEATLGVLGGMGPLASAEFVNTIYEFHRGGREQELPRVVLDSDPAFPDRTEAIRSGRTDEITERLRCRVADLLSLGANRIVVACFTAHRFLRDLDPELLAPVVSLVDTAISELCHAEGTFLMLSTSGTRQAGIFQDSPRWALVANRVVLPTDRDQELVHRLVYRMKQRGAGPEVLAEVDLLMTRYGCTGVVAGCTEFHLVSKDFVSAYGSANVVDALRSIAIGLPGLITQPLARPSQGLRS